MENILIINLKASTLKQLRKRATDKGHPLEKEVSDFLDQALAEETRARQVDTERIRAMFQGRKFSDSAPLIREDRDR